MSLRFPIIIQRCDIVNEYLAAGDLLSQCFFTLLRILSLVILTIVLFFLKNYMFLLLFSVVKIVIEVFRRLCAKSTSTTKHSRRLCRTFRKRKLMPCTPIGSDMVNNGSFSDTLIGLFSNPCQVLSFGTKAIA